MAAAPPKKRRKSSNPVPKEPRKKASKTKAPKEAAAKINMKGRCRDKAAPQVNLISFRKNQKIVADTESKEDIPKDSDEVVKTVSHYGTEYFSNPRRLKRFVNNFRLHAYLAKITGFEISLDRLARFLVLTEKWPGLVKILNENQEYLDILQNAIQVEGNYGKVDLPRPENTDEQEKYNFAIQSLNEPQIRDLFVGEEPITSKELFGFSNWYGFRYYK